MAHLDWLDRAAKAVNSDPAFRKLGSTDMRIAFKAGAVARGITFEAFEVTKVQDVDENDLRDWELVIDMPARNWTNYLRQRATGRGPSLVSLDIDRNIVKAPDPLARLKFERFHLSLQALVDKGARWAARPRAASR